MIKRLLFIAVFMALLVPLKVFAEDTGATITGRVINGSTLQPVKNIKVRLRAFKKDRRFSFAKEVSILTDNDGNFEFSGLDKGFVYTTNVDYKFISYGSGEPVVFNGTNRVRADVTVYEPSEEGEKDIMVEERHFIVDGVKEGVLEITEVFTIVNTGKTAFIGKIKNENHGRVALIIPLIEGYENLSRYTRGDLMDFLDMSGELMVRSRILPGQNTLSYSYQLRYSGGKRNIYIPLGRSENLRPKTFNILLPKGMEAEGNNLVKADTIRIEGSDYNLYKTAAPFKADSRELKITLTGLPHKNKFFAVLIFFFSFVFLFILVYVLIKKKRSGYKSSVESDRDRLIKEIALMDESFKRNELGGDEYRFERARLLDELVRIETDKNGE